MVEGQIALLASIPVFYSIIFLRRISDNYEAPAFTLLQISWFNLGLTLVILGFSLIFQLPLLYISRTILLGVSLITLDYGLSLLEYDRIIPFRFSITVSLASILVFSGFTQDSVSTTLIYGTISYQLTGVTFLLFIVSSIWLLVLHMLFFWKVLVFAPEGMKSDAKQIFLTISIGGVVTILSFVSGITNIIPSLDTIIFSLVVFNTYKTLQKSPRLLFFNIDVPLKLIIMEVESGNRIYSYDWMDDEIRIPTPLFATALESLHIFIRESLNHGKLVEIKLEQGLLMIHHDISRNLSFVLLVRKSSYITKYNFQHFVDVFINQKPSYSNLGNTIVVKEDDTFQELVQTIF